MPDRLVSIIEELSQQNPFNGRENLPDPPRPNEAAIPRDRPSVDQIPFIQEQISLLTYNHLPRTFFSLEKHRPLQTILISAKEMLTEALPIRCLEATFVALHFTQNLRDIDRIPLSFKSQANGNFYRHIVLILRTRSTPALYGALGLSRKPTLMYKPLVHHSLFDLIMNYKKAYEALGHKLVDIKLGIAITHDEHSRFDPCWRFIALKLDHYLTKNREGSPSRSSVELRRIDSPQVLHRPARKSPGGGEASLSRSSNDPLPALPPLSLGMSRTECSPLATPVPSSAQRTHSERLPNGQHGEAGRGNKGLCGGPINTSGSPTTHILPMPVGTDSSSESMDGSASAYAPLEQLLNKYMRLLPTISEQYYKSIATVDSASGALLLCFLDLDLACKDAGIENTRRLEYISNMQSPLSAEAKRVASTRQLRPTPKLKDAGRRSLINNGLGSNSTGGSGGDWRRRQARSRSTTGGHNGSGAMRHAPPTSPLPSVLSENKQVTSAVSEPHRHSSYTHPSVAAPLLSRTHPSPARHATVAYDDCTSLAAALSKAEKAFVAISRTTVYAQGGDTSSPLEYHDTAVEGFLTPQNDSPRALLEDALTAPPCTPRNCNVSKPLSPYRDYSGSASSSSNLFSPS